MAIQQIGVGDIANDGTGDTLRSAGIKINSNFSEVYSGVTSTTIVSSSGAIDISVGTVICSNGGSISLTLDDAENSGKIIRIIADNTGTVNVTPSSLSGGSSVAIASGGVLELIYGTATWYIINEGNTNLTIS